LPLGGHNAGGLTKHPLDAQYGAGRKRAAPAVGGEVASKGGRASATSLPSTSLNLASLGRGRGDESVRGDCRRSHRERGVRPWPEDR